MIRLRPVSRGGLSLSLWSATYSYLTDAARKVEAERRGKAEADKKTDEAKKKAAKEAHDAQVKAVMAANDAASPGMTDAESKSSTLRDRRSLR